MCITPCKHFLTKGYCHFELNCDFLHAVDKDIGGGQIEVEVKYPEEYENTKPCHFFWMEKNPLRCHNFRNDKSCSHSHRLNFPPKKLKQNEVADIREQALRIIEQREAKGQGKGAKGQDKASDRDRQPAVLTARQPERARQYHGPPSKAHGKDKRQRGDEGWYGKGQRYEDDWQASWSWGNR